jgi:hypothetical protein
MRPVLIALGAALATLPVAAFLFAHSEATLPLVEYLPVCRSGWKRAEDVSKDVRYIPFVYGYQISKDSLPGMVGLILFEDGSVAATVHPGQTAIFDCFDDDGDSI